MRKTKSETRRAELRRLLQSMRDQERQREQEAKARAEKRERRRAERALVKEGKRPFFLKSRDEKKLQLLDKYEDLKKKGKLKQAMRSRRKHLSSKVGNRFNVCVCVCFGEVYSHFLSLTPTQSVQKMPESRR